MIARRAFFLAALALMPECARAWDAAGHMLVDRIAWEQTKPDVRARVDEHASKLENTYNEAQPYHFVTTGCWMDDMRSKKDYAWSKWHYVNIAGRRTALRSRWPATGSRICWTKRLRVRRTARASLSRVIP